MKSKLIFCALVLVLLGACGKKPGFVDPPAGEETPFPRTYPAPYPPPETE